MTAYSRKSSKRRKGKDSDAVSVSDEQLAAFEKRLGYKFSNRTLLVQSLTHKSAFDGKVLDHTKSYQRLEFLGDRVLALVIAEMLFVNFSEAEEGELARRLTGLVRNETCADVAVDLAMGDVIFMSAGEARAGGRTKAAILGDICEAVIAAIYLDGGMKPADAFIHQNWSDKMLSWDKPLRDPKTTLQEWSHSQRLPTPIYKEVERSGPDHALQFVIEVSVADLVPTRGEGGSKRDAQQAAAQTMLVREGVWEEQS